MTDSEFKWSYIGYNRQAKMFQYKASQGTKQKVVLLRPEEVRPSQPFTGTAQSFAFIREKVREKFNANEG